jgi:hypothetical protein
MDARHVLSRLVDVFEHQQTAAIGIESAIRWWSYKSRSRWFYSSAQD